MVNRPLDIIRAARRVKAHTNTLRRAVWGGELACEKRSGKLFFRVEDLDSWNASRSRVERYSPDPEKQALEDLSRVEKILAREKEAR